jgi:hypothetical protein
MGIHGEIAEEMTEESYKEGFFHGMFWFVTVPVLGSLVMIEKINTFFLRKKWKKEKQERKRSHSG